jgi:DNA-binding NarL/FixJ family response regulator
MSPSLAKPRILLIDDEEYFRIFLSKLFEGEQIEVVSVGRGREGIGLLEQETFSLIVVDYQLPDMQGTEVLEWLQAHEIGTPRIMVTAYGTIDLAVRALKSGAVDFFTKPLADPPAFVRFLNRTLAGGRGAESITAEAASSVERSAHSRNVFPADIDSDRVRELCTQLQPPVALSRREYDVIAALLRGLSNKEIASTLYISERTVKNHLTNVYRKFGVDGRSQLFNRILVDLA